jgi:hypothetical protein
MARGPITIDTPVGDDTQQARRTGVLDFTLFLVLITCGRPVKFNLQIPII